MDARRRSALALCALAASFAVAAPAAAQDAPVACTERSLRGAECGTVAVPLDHRSPAAGTLRVAYARYPATGARTGTLVVAPGGPGQPGLPGAGGEVRTTLRALRATYDLVFYDPRGTGRSDALRCTAAPDGRFATGGSATRRLEQIAQCGEELGARRAFFTTFQESQDIDVLRRAVGAERITVFGTSYGAQVAGEYARRFPGRTAAVVLDSASPIEGIDLLGRLPQLALPRVLREICFPPQCAARFGRNPVGVIRAAVLRLNRSPVRGRVVLPSGRTRTLALRARDLSAVVGASDVDQLARSEMLAAARAVAAGDGAPLARLVVRLSGGGTVSPRAAVNEVRFLATSCVEAIDLPWSPASPAGPERIRTLETALEARQAQFLPFLSGTLAPFGAVTECLSWPSTPPSPRAASEGPAVPVLILAGREDLRTPLEDQRRAAAQFPQARVIAVPDVGHSVLARDGTGCARRALVAFLTGGPVQLCTERGRRVPVAPPFAQRLTQFATDPDVPALVARTASAVDLTLRDVTRQLLGVVSEGDTGGTTTDDVSLRAGGLRGGRVSVGRGAIRMTAYEVVPGVRLTGTLVARTTAGRIVVTGTGANGTLRVTSRGFTGTLGGVPIRLRAPAA